ncbi:ATP-binding protein [Variovorax sp. GB1R11]|uniref:ATP-binding protein n=1 Tax=Variovorax sp. GB1R11 TaxID=3443741 RepID=UPI003F45602B
MTSAAEQSKVGTEAPTEPPKAPMPHIGSFVLETLTLGMYGDPRHTLREYVQNAFDSLRTAKRTKLVSDTGRVVISFDEDAIRVFDNGPGVPAAQAWSTLTSIGASKKERKRDAGFRGIGRLAGMAYCKTLTFRTRFPGEDTVTSVRFDCEALMAAMSPEDGSDLALGGLLQRAITMVSEPATAADEPHFFEVVLSGVEKTHPALRDVSKVKDYLRETSPVPFDPNWKYAAAITKAYSDHFGEAMETIDLTLKTADSEERIYKLYGDEYEIDKEVATLTEVTYTSDAKAGFWSWVGRLSVSGAVVGNGGGLRVRLRNIQVDGTDLIEELFAEIKPSYRRFTYYYIGEIHVDPARVIPNARRDNFEETEEWLDTKAVIRNILLDPLRQDAYSESKKGTEDAAKTITDINDLVVVASTLAEGNRATYDRVVDLMTKAKRLRRRALAAKKRYPDASAAVAVVAGAGSVPSLAALEDAAKAVEDVETSARMLLGQQLDDNGRLDALKARVREQAIREVLDVVQVYVDAPTFQRIKKHVLRSED